MSIQFKRYSGSPDSGGAKLNIAYGDTAPEDTSKLWINSEEPSNISFPVVWKPEHTVDEVIDTGAKLPTATSNIGAAAVGTKIYLFGGQDLVTGDLNTIQVYDTTNNTIQTLSTTLPTAASNIGVAAVGTKIYLFGGQVGGFAVNPWAYADYFLDTIQVFDTTNNTIQTLSTTLPIAAGNITATAVGTKIYLFGGTGNRAYVFDTTNNTIQDLDCGSPIFGYGIAAAAVGTKIYLFGGTDGYETSEYTYIYDTTNNTMQQLPANFPSTYLLGAGAAAVGTKIYLFGGASNPNFGLTNTIQVFDTVNETLQTLPTTLRYNQIYITATTVGANIYLFCEMNLGVLLDNILQFATDVSSNDIVVTQKDYSLTFTLLKPPTEVEIGCKNVYKGDQNLAKLIDAYVYDGANWVNVNTDEITLTKLYAPTISISGKTLTITNDSRNGSYVTNYKVYNGSALLTTITATTLDLTTVITANGTYNISVIATGTGYTDSDNSNVVEFSYGVYNITTNLTNVTATASNPTTVSTVASSTLTFTANTGYNLPDNVTVTGAEFTWTKSSGTLVLSNPTGAVSVTVAGVAKSYTITSALTNVAAASGNATSIAAGETKTLTYTAESGYTLPESVTVIGADFAWTKSKGPLVLSNPTDNVSITVTGVAISRTITATLTNVTAASGNATTIATGETKVLTYTAASGYTLPDTVTVTGATGVWNKDAGTLTLSNPTANVTFSIAGVAAAVTKYNVTIAAGGGSGGIEAVYDGTNSSGTYLGSGFGTYEISSGHIYYETGAASILSISVSGGVSEDGTVTGDGTITIEFTCLTGDMLITLADGSQKRIDEITLDDKVLSYNPETMQAEEDTITYCDSDKIKTDNKYDVWTFSDGTIVKTVHRHRLYNVERQSMTYMDEWKIGEHAINIDGAEIELIGHETIIENVRHFTIFTKNQNYFVNGLLSGNRHTKKMNLPN